MSVTQEELLRQVQAPTELIEDTKTRAGFGDTAAQLPAGTSVTPVTQEVQQDELVTKTPDLTDLTVDTQTAPKDKLEVTAPTKPEAEQVDTATTAQDVGTMEAAQLEAPSAGSLITEVPQGVVSEGALAQAAQGEVSKESTVRYQIGDLMSSIKTGEPLPAWAAGAARGATAVMQQRGLGASSMASAAMVQALMEAGIPIAAADAKTYSAMDMANLSARQQTTLANAATIAAMDKANLDARLTAAVNNAKAFLSLDLQNLDNRQKTNTLNYQAELQAIFTDAAAENATQQFNAKSQMQVDQFFAELDVQVQNANSNRVAAMEQFNVSESNAMTQFIASINDARQRFNSQMQMQIDQSNAVWRRDINTANTAIQNETNRVNAANLLNMTTQAQNQLWQKYRDEAAWAVQMSENAQQRAHQVGMLAMENDYNMSLYETQFENESLVELGRTAVEVVYGLATG